MSRRNELPAGPFLVVGLARSGVAAALALKRHNCEVIGCDSGSPEGVERLTQTGVEVHLDTDGLDLLKNTRTVVKSPGVPREAPVIARAHELGLTVIGEMELAWRMLENEFVAVTGTNGKTTTTELIGHIYRSAERPVAVCGNVGLPVSELVGEIDEDATVVCEASSFQLEDTERFRPDGAVLLNLTADHLDRHGTFEDYRDAKLQIFVRQNSDDVAVIPSGLEELEIGGEAERLYFGDRASDDVSAREGSIWWGDEESVLALDELPIPGRHNVENAMAAVAITKARNFSTAEVREGLKTFPGVEHRLEKVAEIDGTLYVNDSKATNVDSTVKALESFDGGIHLILGGRNKGATFESLCTPITEHCDAIYLIGEASEEITADLGELSVPVERTETLARAVELASQRAESNQVVLLSPACASFDQFSSYEDRGRSFKELVGELS